jgi:hypothetical protein
MIKLKRLRWARLVTHLKDKMDAYRIWIGKLESKSLVGIPRRMWKNPTKTDLR